MILDLPLRLSADADLVDAPGRPVPRLDSTLPAGGFRAVIGGGGSPSDVREQNIAARGRCQPSVAGFRCQPNAGAALVLYAASSSP